MGLRIRSAATGGSGELYARIPTSVISDSGLSDGAVRHYGALRLWMIEHNQPIFCFATMADLGRLCGVSDREARRRTTELEVRGHVARERVHTIKGSPQGIRPIAAFRPPNLHPSNRTRLSAHPDRFVRVPGPDCPPTRTGSSGPLKREKRERKQNGEKTSVVSTNGPGRPSIRPDEEAADPQAIAAALAGLLALPGVTQARAARIAAEARTARKKAPGVSGKNPPGPNVGNSIPNKADSTSETP